MENLKPEDKLLLIIHKEVTDIEYGMISVSIIVRNNIPILNSLNIHRAKRIKFPLNLT
jgi:hypothetical protein